MKFIVGILTTLVLIAGLSFGRTAQVIQLSEGDASLAKHVHEQLEEAKKAVADFDSQIQQKYTTNATKSPDGYDRHLEDKSSCHHFGGTWNDSFGGCSNANVPFQEYPEYKEGWGGGIEYSEDWKSV